MVENEELKTEYVHCLMDFINQNLNNATHKQVFKRMQEIEEYFKTEKKQRITITVSTEDL